MIKSTSLFSRRTALHNLSAVAMAISMSRRRSLSAEAEAPTLSNELTRIADEPVLKTDFLTSPVKVVSIELLKLGSHFLVRTRSTDGVEVITVPHQDKMTLAYPVLIKSVIPAFLKQDARSLEALQWEAYRRGSNYKMQGLLYGVAIMAVEQALLELMGQTAQRPLTDFFGGATRRDVPVYFASGNRDNTPEAEIAHLQKLVADSGVNALKFRIGGRMSRNADNPPQRSETLIPLVRKTFGDSVTLYADANSSYDATEAIRIGRIMEAHDYAFYEEPCEFDDLWCTKDVTEALTIPIALGEQEFSLHRWKWCIANRVADIMQPDLHYGGGFIRATKVARMAAAVSMNVVPHMSGGGLGYLDLVHFASFTPNVGPHMEFTGNASIPVASTSASLKWEQGVVRCPTGPGFGVTIDPDFVNRAEIMTL